MLPLCSRSHAFTPSHSLFAFKSKKHTPLCSHFFFHLAYFFFLSLDQFFNNLFFSYHLIMLSLFFPILIFVFSVSTTLLLPLFFLMLSLCSHTSIFFIFSFFISVSGGTLTRLVIFQLFPTSTSNLL